MSRPRLAVLFAVLAAAAALVASSCSTFAGPAWQVGDVTMSVDQFQADYDASLTDTDRATTTSGRLPTSGIAAFMTNQIQQEILNQGLQELGLDVSQEDLDNAELAIQQQAQQSGSSAMPSDQDISNQAKIVKLGTKLVTDEVEAGEFDLEAASRKAFDDNADRLSTPAQTCLHAILILADPDATTATTATDEQKAEALAQAQAARSRLETEDFATVADEVSVLKDQYPGGDLDCQPTEEIAPVLAAIVDPLQPGQLSEPTFIEGDNGYVILRVDSRTEEAPAKYEDFQEQAAAFVIQERTNVLVEAWLREQARSAFVLVDARFGTWNAETLQVVPPDGAATPTVPTTAAAPFDPATIGGIGAPTAPGNTGSGATGSAGRSAGGS